MATRLQSQERRGWFGNTSEEPIGCSQRNTACTAMLTSMRITTLHYDEHVVRFAQTWDQELDW